MIKNFLGQTMIEKLFFSIGISLSVIGGILTLYIPLLIKRLIDGSIEFSLILNIIAIGILSTLFMSASSYILLRFSEQQIKKLRNSIIDNLLYKEVSFFDNNNSGSLSSRIINDTENLRGFIAHNIPDLVNGLVLILGGSIMLFMLDWKLALVILLGLLMLILLLNPLSKLNGRYTQKRQTALSQLSGFLSEIFQQIRTIKSEQSEHHKKAVSEKHTHTIFKISINSVLIDSLISPLVFFILFSILIVIFTYGGMRVSNNSISTGTLISFFIYLIQLLTPISKVGNFFNHYAKTKGSTQEIMQILNDKTEFNQLGQSISNIDEITISHVSFSYKNNEKILSDISMNFKKGQKIALVGPSGSGKSTIISLLEKFYVPTKGFIKFDNINLDEISLNSLRKQITLISQDNNLFSGNIYDNLIASFQVPPSNNAINESLKKSNVFDEIKELGLFTNIGEKGSHLSEGQKQRVQISKIFLRNTNIIILDEATSNLDSYSEKIIMKSINDIRKDKILIVIAHRLSNIKDSDCIYYIDKGKVSGKGTHDYLMSNHTGYRNLILNQKL